jgi:hypothetical protein
MSSICEACEIEPCTAIERCDDEEEPYLLCAECHGRLHRRALRPLEWFNLAKRHGWSKFLLHDDFYDDDGQAGVPDGDVENPERYPAPTLRDVQGSASRLLEYTVTRWHLTDDLRAAWRVLPPGDVLATLLEQFAGTRNRSVRAAVLRAAALLGPDGERVALQAWQAYPDVGSFWRLAEATASCLPLKDGFDRVVSALSRMDGPDWRESFSALAHFRSRRTLDWIESHVSEPLVESWGYLAAASDLNWPRAENWLAQGRPLSLVALDALLAIAKPRTPFLQYIRPTLAEAPSETVIRHSIESLMQRDPVPRVKQRGRALMELLPALQ